VSPKANALAREDRQTDERRSLRQSFGVFLVVTLRRDPMGKDKEKGHLERRAYRRSCLARLEGPVEHVQAAAGEGFVVVHLDFVRTDD
jgi:hypothetical protein